MVILSSIASLMIFQFVYVNQLFNINSNTKSPNIQMRVVDVRISLLVLIGLVRKIVLIWTKCRRCNGCGHF